jgi:predicted MPP superfamily phosphohydrolase
VISRAFIIAIASVVGVVLFVAALLRPLPGGEKSKRRLRWWKIFRVAIVVILISIAGSALWALFIEPDRLVVHRQTVQIDNWPKQFSGLRVALIGDVHTGGPFIDHQKLRRIVDLTNQENPDLIVLLGDYMSPDSWHSHKVEPEVTAGVLKDLRAPLGVYAVLGNHDWWYNGEKVGRALEDVGIHVLENDVAEIKWRDKSFWLVGFADIWTRRLQIKETIAKVTAGAPIIGLTHNPDLFPRLPQTVPLLLAAHTHGGQVNIPLIGTPVVPSRFGSKYNAGHIFENNHHLFVTTGIGTSILPVRFRVPPEIVILTITS